jgi:hypothetical protein
MLMRQQLVANEARTAAAQNNPSHTPVATADETVTHWSIATPCNMSVVPYIDGMLADTGQCVLTQGLKVVTAPSRADTLALTPPSHQEVALPPCLVSALNATFASLSTVTGAVVARVLASVSGQPFSASVDVSLLSHSEVESALQAISNVACFLHDLTDRDLARVPRFQFMAQWLQRFRRQQLTAGLDVRTLTLR